MWSRVRNNLITAKSAWENWVSWLNFFRASAKINSHSKSHILTEIDRNACESGKNFRNSSHSLSIKMWARRISKCRFNDVFFSLNFNLGRRLWLELLRSLFSRLFWIMLECTPRRRSNRLTSADQSDVMTRNFRLFSMFVLWLIVMWLNYSQKSIFDLIQIPLTDFCQSRQLRVSSSTRTIVLLLP